TRIGFHGGALLHADTLALQGFGGGFQTAAFARSQANRHDVHGLAEVDDLGTCLSSRHGGVGQIEFAGLQAGDQAVKGLIDRHALGVQALTDFVAGIDVKALQLATAVQKREGGVARFSGKTDFGRPGCMGSSGHQGTAKSHHQEAGKHFVHVEDSGKYRLACGIQYKFGPADGGPKKDCKFNPYALLGQCGFRPRQYAALVDVAHDLVQIVGQDQQIQVFGANQAHLHQLLTNPVEQAGPKGSADQYNGCGWDFARLDQSHDFKQLVQGTEAARQGNVSPAVHEKGGLARVEVLELQALCLVRVVGGFVGQAYIQANTLPACFVRAFIGGFHQARAAACNQGDARFGQTTTQFLGQFVVRMTGFDACAAENTTASTHFF